MKPFAYLIVSGLLLCGPIRAQHWHDDAAHYDKHWKHQDRDDDHDRDHSARDCYFRPQDARVIGEYYSGRAHKLPPGLQKKLYRSGHLPPGWQRRMQPLPVVVERRLEPLPTGYRRGYLDGYVVVYSPRTQVVIDLAFAFGR